MNTLSIYQNFQSKILNLNSTHDFCATIYDLCIPESLHTDSSFDIIAKEIEKLNEKSKLIDIEIIKNNQKTLKELSLIAESFNDECIFIFSIDNILQYENLFNSINIPLIINIADEEKHSSQCLIFDNPEDIKSKLLSLNSDIQIEYKIVKLKDILEKLLIKFSF